VQLVALPRIARGEEVRPRTLFETSAQLRGAAVDGRVAADAVAAAISGSRCARSGRILQLIEQADETDAVVSRSASAIFACVSRAPSARDRATEVVDGWAPIAS